MRQPYAYQQAVTYCVWTANIMYELAVLVLPAFGVNIRPVSHPEFA